MRILLVEDDKLHRITLTDLLRREGDEIVPCEDGDAGRTLVQEQTFDVVLSDLRLPGTGGLDILREVRERQPHTVVIMMTAYGTVDSAVEALKLGAYDYLTKPFPPDRLLSILRHVRQFRRMADENAELRQRLLTMEQRTIVGDSPAMRKLLETVRLVAARDYTVLLRGESGTGKELVAHALHEYSPRRDHPFVTLNCAALPASLLESELFGHERGAFTGAVRQHEGYFARAAGGTVFIDEIDDFPLPLQPRLLRVLQEKEIVRVGGSKSIAVDARIICATKADLQAEVQAGRFRADLFYRLNIIPITIPPLRDRRDDIVPLINHFLDKHGAREKLRLLTPAILEALRAHAWPGNVRELENFVERLVALSDTVPCEEIVRETLPADRPAPPSSGPNRATTYAALMESHDREIIDRAMREAGGNVTVAAKLLGLPRSTLRSKLEKRE